ncbi:NAD(P)-dependent oxidoreductase [Pseudotabrizicola sp. 4114]|uniref:NAD-dependent epimerase/dehydratase family protein n=1 Tax=Pseudotabrizicola sp. 4114 TaxID=2817731 RepID=UPI00285D8481|nr:uronate dehydrogenase [Pseudorhodobacter sp. 4114]
MAHTPDLPQAILVTGAAGNIGRSVARHLAAALTEGRIARLRLVDIAPIDNPLREDHPGLERMELSLSTRAAADQATRDMDAVIHLAGIPSESSWDKLIDANLAGPAYLWDACVAHGVDRVLFASSNHAIGMHPSDSRIDHSAALRPDSRYGATKAFGELVAGLYAAKTPVRAYCMRIGSCFEHVTARRHMKTFQSLADFNRLIDTGLTADYHYEVVYGLSDIPDGYWDNSNAHRLGYAPQDHPSDFLDESLNENDYPFQGGEVAEAPLSPDG